MILMLLLSFVYNIDFNIYQDLTSHDLMSVMKNDRLYFLLFFDKMDG